MALSRDRLATDQCGDAMLKEYSFFAFSLMAGAAMAQSVPTLPSRLRQSQISPF